MRNVVPPPWFVLSLVALLAACGAGDRAGERTVIRDSAGIAIVANRGPGVWTEDEAWTVSAEPIVEIGVVDGDPAYQLHRVQDAVRLSDGRVVVANAGTHELRIYSDDGAHLRTVGGQGGGPGEFEGISLLERIRGDTLLVYDIRSRRVSLFSPDGDFVRDVRPEAPRLTVADALDAGTLVGRTVDRVDSRPDEITRDTVIFHLVGSDGTLGSTIGRFPGHEMARRIERSGNTVTTYNVLLPFHRATFIAGGGGRVFVGTSDRWEIRVFDHDRGGLRRLIRRPDRPADELTRAMFDRYIEQRITALDAEGRDGRAPTAAQIREGLESRPRVTAVPAFAELEVDDAGRLWVREYAMPWHDDRPARWNVHDADGRLLGTVEVPADLRVTHIARDAVVGITRDDLDVEHVRVYALRRPGG